MAKLPDSFSLQAIPIRSALQEGRTEDARTIVFDLLRRGQADKVVQSLAAAMLKPAPRKRGRPKALPAHWHDIGSMFDRLRDEGIPYEIALSDVAKRFGYSETHVRNCIEVYERAQADHDAATRE